ncbi:hypothetical protein RvY_13328 [Ramazzottius varieornatus]|uniref:Uncharacterized protein n=1 Tax=Ramazzottius varieornatus TaxID=947166 RepID=A0A1D1VSU4_RAMVA|nr:hypothetical protein RvY_13328 [Ramazzottius varieornatus]
MKTSRLTDAKVFTGEQVSKTPMEKIPLWPTWRSHHSGVCPFHEIFPLKTGDCSEEHFPLRATASNNFKPEQLRTRTASDPKTSFPEELFPLQMLLRDTTSETSRKFTGPKTNVFLKTKATDNRRKNSLQQSQVLV